MLHEAEALLVADRADGGGHRQPQATTEPLRRARLADRSPTPLPRGARRGRNALKPSLPAVDEPLTRDADAREPRYPPPRTEASTGRGEDRSQRQGALGPRRAALHARAVARLLQLRRRARLP